MKKRILGILLCVPMILTTPVIAFAADDEGGRFEINDKGDGALVSGGGSSSGSTIITPDGEVTKPSQPDTPVDPTPDNPTPEDPKPDTPTPDDPTPDKPTPDNPTPDDPTPDKPNNSGGSTYYPPSSGGSGGGTAIQPGSKDKNTSTSSSSSSTSKNDKTDDTKDEDTDAEEEDTLPRVSYRDVPSREWYYDAVVYVTQKGMMAGNNGNFSPNSPFTRGMMAQILHNLEDKPTAQTASFPDVPATEWYATPVSWASAQGFMSGYTNGKFGPNDPITREQIASILYRYSQEKRYDTTGSADISRFSDAATTSDWAEPAVRWALNDGLLSGKTGVAGTRLDPGGTATRAEVAQILMNFGKKIEKEVPEGPTI